MILFQVGSLRGYYHFKHVGKGSRHKRHIHEKTKLLLSEEEVRLLRFIMSSFRIRLAIPTLSHSLLPSQVSQPGLAWPRGQCAGLEICKSRV